MMSRKMILTLLSGSLMLSLGAASVEVKWFDEARQLPAAKKAEAELRMENGVLNLKGGKNYLLLTPEQKFEVVPGSCFRVNMKISGTGAFGFCATIYDKDGKAIGSEMLTRRVKGKPGSINDYVRVKKQYKGKTPAFAAAGPYVYPKCEGTLSDVKITFEKEIPNPTLTPLNRTDWARKSYENLTKKAKSSRNVPLMFLGDSITYGWSTPAKSVFPGGKEVWNKVFQPMGAVNFGVSADRVEHVLWRITEGKQLACHPRVIVLLIGTNNFARTFPEEIAVGIDNLLKVIHEKSPESKVLLLAIYPRKGTHPVAETNELLVKVAAKNKVEFMSLNEMLLQGKKEVSKEIFRDGLHLSPKGYEMVAEALLPKVKEMLNQK